MDRRCVITVSLVALTVCVVSGTAVAATRNVPADYLTIQAAINAAGSGDTVLVQPGTYHERINFGGKAITVTSTDIDNPAATVIDGDAGGSVVTFSSGEGNASLRGFKIMVLRRELPPLPHRPEHATECHVQLTVRHTPSG